MKFLNWMQNKVKSRGPPSISSTHHHTLDEACKDEFNDWPHALLAIGTFGISNNLKQVSGTTRTNTSGSSIITEDSSSSSQNRVPEPIPEQEEDEELEERDFEKELNNTCNSNDQKDTFFSISSLIPGRGRDLCFDNSKSGIGKKSLSFLLKKMFVCRSGFQHTPSFKDPLPAESRMEKILRAILNKKIYPQASSTSTMIIKKYLEDKHKMAKSDNDEEEEEDFNDAAEDGSKWVKTDSEYIVLEI